VKALTLTQPWATLVAIGAKRVETRSWEHSHRGPVAIHAAKGMPRYAIDAFLSTPFYNETLVPAGYTSTSDLPRGCIVAVARVAQIVPTERWIDYAAQLTPGGAECAFGDYSLGRFMWFLEDVRELAMPIPAVGRLGLWDWPDHELRGVRFR
jgi:hypothetical protein